MRHLLNLLSVVLRLTQRRFAAYPATMQIIEMSESDQIAPPCCECHKAMRHVGTELATISYVMRRTFECSCGTIMIEDATLH